MYLKIYIYHAYSHNSQFCFFIQATPNSLSSYPKETLLQVLALYFIISFNVVNRSLTDRVSVDSLYLIVTCKEMNMSLTDRVLIDSIYLIVTCKEMKWSLTDRVLIDSLYLIVTCKEMKRSLPVESENCMRLCIFYVST